MTVLLAIEMLISITIYLRENVLDYNEVSSDHVFATAALLLALSVACWLAVVRNTSIKRQGER